MEGLIIGIERKEGFMLFIGIILGTSAVKLLSMGEEGEPIHNKWFQRDRDLYLFHSRGMGHEQKPDDWMSRTMEEAEGAALPNAPKGTKRQWKVSVLADRDAWTCSFSMRRNQVIRRLSCLWNDGRTGKETDYLNQVIGKDKAVWLIKPNIAFS
jgi:xylulokinase